MIIDSVDISELGNNAEEAFVVFEERLRAVLMPEQDRDRGQNESRDGYYTGSYAPQRNYVSSIVAFLDEYDLAIDKVVDISEVDNDHFLKLFNDFFNRINYARTRFKLRKEKIGSGQVGTPIMLGASYKDEIHKNLDTIRKIVNSNVADENKKDAIYKHIALLQSEIDRDRTTFDAFLSRWIDLSKVIGESSENLEPAVQKLERIMAAFRDGAKRINLLPKKEQPQLLTSAEKKELADDEIPF